MAHLPRRIAVLALLAAGLAFFSCSLLLDPPLRIVEASPSTELVEASAVKDICIAFSRTPRKSSAEEAFSLRADGNRVSGRFSWEGARMRFTPNEGLSAGRRYEVAVESSAEDESGVSLATPYKFVFSTRGDSLRPAVVSLSPTNGSTLNDRLHPVVVTFSKAMDESSVYRSLVVSPGFKAVYSWNPEGTVCSMTPIEELAQQTEYLVTVQTAATDRSGNQLVAEASARFRIGTESTPPSLLSAHNFVAGAAGAVALRPSVPGDSALAVNGGWESTWGIEFVFSEAVKADTVKSSLSIDPSFGFDLRCDGGDYGTTMRIVPSERLRYGSACTITLRKGVEDLLGNKTREDSIYHLKVNGAASRPPEILSLSFLKNPDGAIPAYAVYDISSSPQFGILPVDSLAYVPATAKQTSIDLVVRLADGAAIDPFSLMEAFSVSTTNSCASVSPTRIEYPVAAPATPPPPGASVIRIWCDFTNRNSSGLITFRVASGFQDNKGNKTMEDWALPLNK